MSVMGWGKLLAVTLVFVQTLLPAPSAERAGVGWTRGLAAAYIAAAVWMLIMTGHPSTGLIGSLLLDGMLLSMVAVRWRSRRLTGLLLIVALTIHLHAAAGAVFIQIPWLNTLLFIGMMLFHIALWSIALLSPHERDADSGIASAQSSSLAQVF